NRLAVLATRDTSLRNYTDEDCLIDYCKGLVLVRQEQLGGWKDLAAFAVYRATSSRRSIAPRHGPAMPGLTASISVWALDIVRRPNSSRGSNARSFIPFQSRLR